MPESADERDRDSDTDGERDAARERDREASRTSGREPATGGDRDSRGFTFRLPPITLPPLFPDRLEVQLPVPGYRYARAVSSGWMLVVLLLFDLMDALLALTTTPATIGSVNGMVGAVGPIDAVGLVRTLGGAVIAVSVARGVGLLYLWELLAVIGGYGALTAFPTLVVLGVLWMWRNAGQADKET